MSVWCKKCGLSIAKYGSWAAISGSNFRDGDEEEVDSIKVGDDELWCVMCPGSLAYLKTHLFYSDAEDGFGIIYHSPVYKKPDMEDLTELLSLITIG